jgi:hypothetical protein
MPDSGAQHWGHAVPLYPHGCHAQAPAPAGIFDESWRGRLLLVDNSLP